MRDCTPDLEVTALDECLTDAVSRTRRERNVVVGVPLRDSLRQEVVRVVVPVVGVGLTGKRSVVFSGSESAAPLDCGAP